jgi:putative transposase
MNTRKAYPTNLNNKQWQTIEPLLPKKRQGREATHNRREMLNALLYMARTSCQWQILPPWEAVYAFWRRLVERNLLQQINDALRSKSAWKKTAKLNRV